MALRDQPYLPLYVQDFLTDEKLIPCSPAANGIYIRLMCIMHKSKEYGTFLLLQNGWQKSGKTSGTCQDFASFLAKFLPWTPEEIEPGLQELLDFGVLQIQENKLIQKRMVRDNDISIKRSEAGSKGGFAKAKVLANAENEIETVIKSDNEEEKKEVQEEGTIKPKLSAEDYQLLIDTYHNLCPKMNKVQVINDTRKGYMNARVGEYEWGKVVTVIRMAGESEFLNGKNERAWKADFDWIMRPVNFVKILEGKFRNIGRINAPKTYEEMVKLAETNPEIFKHYKAVKRDGERKAVFIPIEETINN